jgi:hypothetical protein
MKPAASQAVARRELGQHSLSVQALCLSSVPLCKLRPENARKLGCAGRRVTKDAGRSAKKNGNDWLRSGRDSRKNGRRSGRDSRKNGRRSGDATTNYF